MTLLRRALLGAALLASTSIGARADTLYADLGGPSGIDRITTKVIEIWQADPRVAPIFEETNLVRLKRLLVADFCKITDGGCEYTGRSMVDVHKGLHLRTVHFNAVAEDLQTAMRALDIPYSLQNRFIARLAPMQREIVSQ